MRIAWRDMRALSAGLATAAWMAGASAGAQQARPPTPDIHFVPTPKAIVDAMLKLARVTTTDVIYDLGSGDGRIVITAAQKYGARGIGVEIDPELIKEATKNARKAHVADQVTFLGRSLQDRSLRGLRRHPLSVRLHQSTARSQTETRAQTRVAHHFASVPDRRLEAGRRRRGQRDTRLLVEHSTAVGQRLA